MSTLLNPLNWRALFLLLCSHRPLQKSYSNWKVFQSQILKAVVRLSVKNHTYSGWFFPKCGAIPTITTRPVFGFGPMVLYNLTAVFDLLILKQKTTRDRVDFSRLYLTENAGKYFQRRIHTAGLGPLAHVNLAWLHCPHLVKGFSIKIFMSIAAVFHQPHITKPVLKIDLGSLPRSIWH